MVVDPVALNFAHKLHSLKHVEYLTAKSVDLRFESS